MMILENILTEVGFVLLGGVVAAVPIYVLGLILRRSD